MHKNLAKFLIMFVTFGAVTVLSIGGCERTKEFRSDVCKAMGGNNCSP